MAYLAAVGKHLSGSGLEYCGVESGIYSENTADNMVNDKPYHCSIWPHKLTFEAVWRVLIDEFVNWLSTSGRHIDKDFIDDVLCDLLNAFQSSDRHAGRRAVEAMIAHIPTIASLLLDFITEHLHEPTFQYWINYLKMINTLLSFMKIECLGLCHAHLSAFEDVLALLAAHDHINYLRWDTVYIKSMLPHSLPTVYEECVKTTNQAFVRIATDL